MSNIPFSLDTVTQKQWDNHATGLIKRYGAKSAKQFEQEILNMMKVNTDKAYEKFASRAGIQVLPEDNIPYGLRLRLAVIAVTMTFSCKTPREYKDFQEKIEIFCVTQYHKSLEQA